MSCNWIATSKIKIVSWEEESSIIYNISSGDTHLFPTAPKLILERLLLGSGCDLQELKNEFEPYFSNGFDSMACEEFLLNIVHELVAKELLEPSS